MSRAVPLLSALALILALGTPLALEADRQVVVADDVVTMTDSDDPRIFTLTGSSDDRGWMGIQIQDLSDELSKALEVDEDGVLVSDVGEDSPAEKSGLEPRDVILAVNGQRARDVDELMEIMEDTEAGQTVELDIVHDGDRKTIEILLGDQPSSLSDVRVFRGEGPRAFLMQRDRSGKPRLGVEVEEPDEDLASYFGVSKGEGVLVLRVHDDSAAEEAGIKAGDIILEVEGEKVTSVESLIDAVSDAGEGEASIEIRRKGKKMTLTAELEDSGPGDIWVSPGGRGGEGWSLRRFRDRFDSRELQGHMRDLQRDLRKKGREIQGDLKGEMRELRREMERLKDELDELRRDLRDRD